MELVPLARHGYDSFKSRSWVTDTTVDPTTQTHHRRCRRAGSCSRLPLPGRVEPQPRQVDLTSGVDGAWLTPHRDTAPAPLAVAVLFSCDKARCHLRHWTDLPVQAIWTGLHGSSRCNIPNFLLSRSSPEARWTETSAAETKTEIISLSDHLSFKRDSQGPHLDLTEFRADEISVCLVRVLTVFRFDGPQPLGFSLHFDFWVLIFLFCVLRIFEKYWRTMLSFYIWSADDKWTVRFEVLCQCCVTCVFNK